MTPPRLILASPAEVSRLRASGLSDEAIGRHLGVGEKAVAMFRRRHDITVALPRRKLADLDPVRIGHMVAAGMSDRAIGQQFGLSHVSIFNFRQRHGLGSANPVHPAAAAKPKPRDPEAEWTRLLRGRRFG